MISSLIVSVVALAALFGGLCCVTGEKQKGSQILVNCLTAVTLYLVVIQLFHMEISQDGVLSNGLPIVNHVRQFGSIRNLLNNQPDKFAIDFVELTTLILIFQWLANLIAFPNAGLGGKITSSIVLVFIAIIVYGCFMRVVRDNVIMKWCVHCVECIITGGSILYPPIMILSFISGLKKNNFALTYFVSVFPKTALGKAVSSSIASAIIFIAFILTLESQYGCVCAILESGMDLIKNAGGLIVLVMGIYMLLTSVKGKRIN